MDYQDYIKEKRIELLNEKINILNYKIENKLYYLKKGLKDLYLKKSRIIKEIRILNNEN